MITTREAWHVVTFGLTLVLIVATVLFVLVGLNPKQESYGHLPWVYAGLSIIGAAILWQVSGWFAQAASDDSARANPNRMS